MSGTLSTVTINRELLIGAAAELAGLLAAEVQRLERDARALELRGNPMFAANVRSLRRRLSAVREMAEAVTGTGRA